MIRCYNCRGSGRWCVGKCWARVWRRIRTNIQTRRKEVESKRWAWPLTVEASLGLVRVKYFISIATHGFMTTWSSLSTFLQLNSCFCVVKVVVAVGVVCSVLVDVRSCIALFIMWKEDFRMHMGCYFTRTVVPFWLPNVKNSFQSNLEDNIFCLRQAILEEALQNLLPGICFLLLPCFDTYNTKSSLELLHKSISKWIFPKGFLLLISILAF